MLPPFLTKFGILMTEKTFTVTILPISDIIIPDDRFRKEFSERNHQLLQDSISMGPGLINAITVKPNLELNTGESRLKAVSILHELGLPVRYQGSVVPEGCIPAVIIQNDLDEIQYLQAELHENTHRADFTYIEEAKGVARIAALQQEVMNRNNPPLEERKSAAAKGFVGLGIPMSAISKEAISNTASQVYDKAKPSADDMDNVKTSIIIANAMENHPELAEKLSKVKTISDAKKVLKKSAESDQRVALAAAQGSEFKNSVHTIINGDCLEELTKLPKASFDVCLTDPIYGINAGNFGDSAGRLSNFDHTYNDSLENFSEIIPKALKLVSGLLKEKAHIYLACDIRNYPLLKQYLADSSTPGNLWVIPNAPFIQYKLGGGRIPHPGFTPRRSYEVWLYAYRGGKGEYTCINDVVECTSDRTETHGASKPVDLLKTFLKRSCMPGDKVLDFMAGSGPILTACHELKIRATAIEINPDYYGRCLERVKELR